MMLKNTIALSSTIIISLVALACQSATTAPVTAEKLDPPDPRYLELPAVGPRPDWAPPNVNQVQLKNGLTLWHMERKGAPLVSSHLIINRGAATDPQGLEGQTMLGVELLDEGTESLNALALSKRFGEMATSYSAQSGSGFVLFSLNSLAENTEKSLQLLSDIVQKPLLSEEEFERTRDQQLAQLLALKNNPDAVLRRVTKHIVYGGGYGGRPVAGTAQSLKKIQLSELKQHLKALLVPHESHLTIAGDISLEDAKSLARASFGDWQGETTLTSDAVAPAPTKQAVYLIDFPGATQSSLAITRRAGPSSTPEFFNEMVMNERLGGMFTSRINLNLREDKGYTYGATSLFERNLKTGSFSVYAGVQRDSTAASIKEVFNEINALCTDLPIDAQELSEAKEGLLLGFPLKFERIDSLGIRIASLAIHERAASYYQTWPVKVAGVSLENANQAAKPYCDTAGYQIIVAGDASAVEPKLAAAGYKIITLDTNGEVAAEHSTAKDD